ncbi:YybS family protein [Bacillus tianshenii]|uniref:YybS family protein n=1 Tax=Sutcliffiella tianshenii TaxID=1463404 RepID=UPI001CD5959E|nr:YybS family protein [Bacillus tianshenii]MCA1322268.1 YybS family protein [Bacillus tianshenii]
MKTKNITEGAVLLGIFVLLLLMTLFIPGIGVITLFALVVPFVIYTVRNDWKSGIWFAVLANILSLLMGSPAALILSIPMSSVGVVMGYLFAKNSSRYAILGAATGMYLLNLVLGYVVAIVLFEINIAELIDEMLNDSLKNAEAMASALGQNSEETMALMEQMVEQFTYLLPSGMVTIAFVFAFVSQMITGFVLKRLKEPVQPFPPFRDFMLPKSLLWYYLIVILLSLVEMEKGSTLFLATMNLSYILMLLMTVQGMSFIFHFCHEKRIAKAVPIIMLILSFLIPPLLYIIRMVGIIDLGFDLRKRIKK